MARVLGGKRGQILEFIILILIVTSISALTVTGLSQKDKLIQMGAKEFSMLSAYAEGEKALEYLKLSGEFALAKTVDSCANAKTLSEGATMLGAKKEVETYMHNYNSSNPELSAEFPSFYSYQIIKKIDDDKVIWLIATTNENIKVSSSKYKFDYSVNGNFRSAISCQKIEQLESNRLKQMIS